MCDPVHTYSPAVDAKKREEEEEGVPPLDSATLWGGGDSENIDRLRLATAQAISILSRKESTLRGVYVADAWHIRETRPPSGNERTDSET